MVYQKPITYISWRSNIDLVHSMQAVEDIVHPKCKEAKNQDNKTPREIFTESHEELVKAGEKWAKDTASSFTLVATLITTIMFAAAFTVPGGNNQDSGIPMFLKYQAFNVFIIQMQYLFSLL
jgi:hypothetical protein